MNSIDDYIRAARERAGLASDHALAAKLGVSPSLPSAWRTGRSVTSDEEMVKLARLGGQDEAEALIDLNRWRHKRQPEVRKVYEAIASRLAKTGAMAAAAFATSLLPPPAPALANAPVIACEHFVDIREFCDPASVYYEKFRRSRNRATLVAKLTSRLANLWSLPSRLLDSVVRASTNR